MSAGERCIALGVIRLTLGSTFPKPVAIFELHHGIEDQNGKVEVTRIEEVHVELKKVKSLVGAADWKAVERLVEALEDEFLAKPKANKGLRVEKFGERA